MSTLLIFEQYLLFPWTDEFGLEASRITEKIIMAAAKAKNTVAVYASRWKAFEDWCSKAGKCPLPATTETLRLYIAWSVEIHHARLETVKITITSIVDRHKRAGYPSPRTPAIRDFLANCARHLQEDERGKAALPLKHLRKLCSTLTDEPIEARDKAIVLFGFATGWRGEEIASLDLRDISFQGEGIVAHLRKAKDDQEAKGRLVGVHYGKHPETCPVLALQAWLKVRGNQPGPLFLRMDCRGRKPVPYRMRRRNISEAVKRCLRKIGVDDTPYGGHSLRAGFVTAAAGRGSSEISIMDHTGHKSIAMVLKYVRPAQVFKANPLAGIL